MVSTPASTTKFNTLSIVGFVLAFLVSIVGAIISIIALVQINRTGERGKGLAIAGIIIGLLLFIGGISLDLAVLPQMLNR